MSASAEEVVRAHIAALNAHDIAAAQALMAPNCVRHAGWHDLQGIDPPGRGAAERSWRACPDWRYDVQVLVAAGDLVGIMVRASGTHMAAPLELGKIGTFPASGKVLHAAWSSVYRVVAGKIVEYWHTSDLSLLERELGVR